MKREIKFKAWIKIGGGYGKMVYPHLEMYNGVFKLPTNYILLQFTGLKDRKGKPIYEGDIVRAFHKRQYNQIGKVFFEEKRPSFRVRFKNNKDILVRRDLEVIGNIFENPEFLTLKSNKQELDL